MKKRASALALALCLSLLLLPPVRAEAAGFWDVRRTNWFYDSVEYVTSLGLMSGTGSRFYPDDPVQRADLALALYRLDGSPDLGSDTPYQDVSKWNRYRKAISWASQTGTVPGRSDTVYGWYDSLTRREAALCFYRYARCRGLDVSEKADISRYTDCLRETAQVREALSWAVEGEKLLNGPTSSSLLPGDQTSRGHLAVMLTRFCVYYSLDLSAPASWKEIRFDLNAPESGEPVTRLVGENGLAYPPAPPARDGYEFLGWYTAPEGGEPCDFDAQPEDGLTLYARWSRIPMRYLRSSAARSHQPVD